MLAARVLSGVLDDASFYPMFTALELLLTHDNAAFSEGSTDKGSEKLATIVLILEPKQSISCRRGLQPDGHGAWDAVDRARISKVIKDDFHVTGECTFTPDFVVIDGWA
ncbi:hypothetical protein QCA50_012581 [Cerrena zonata]|uniref:Uncharacterized protein n=1 Tax=Cerrena zonata TaxID=2478898 RepID=A0AAW0FY68_9APHY